MKTSLLLIICISIYACTFAQSGKILLITETAGWNHQTKEVSKSMMEGICQELDIDLFHTDSTYFEFLQDVLQDVSIVVLANTTANIFSEREQTLVEHFVNNGGAILGIHAATDTEYEWDWYMSNIGAHFLTHAKDGERAGRIIVEDSSSRSMKPFLEHDTIVEEWYTFNASPRKSVHVLASLDESSYLMNKREEGWFSQKLKMNDHPIIWYKNVGKGIIFYTALGHNPETYLQTYFVSHITETIRWLLE